MTQPEARLQRKIQDELRRRGCFVQKNHGSEHMMAGLPDLVVCYRGLYLGLEIKMPGNELSAIQTRRSEQIRDAGGLFCVCESVDDVLDALRQADSVLAYRDLNW